MPPFEGLSSEAIYAKAVQLYERNEQLEFQLAQFNRLVFGQKRERFIASEPPTQATLFTPDVPVVAPVAAPVIQTGPKPKGQKAGVSNPNHKGRNAFPAHIPRVVTVLQAQEVAANPSHFAKIGQEIVETLDYQPARLFVKQYVKERHAAKPKNEIIAQIVEATLEQNTEIVEHISKKITEDAANQALVPTFEAQIETIGTQIEPINAQIEAKTAAIPNYTEGVYTASMPSRPLPKAIAEAGLLAQIQIDKFIDHLPIDRQAKRWRRESGINITGSTVVEWSLGTYNLLMPLYEKLIELVFDCDYLQADESTIKCLENAPKGKSHTSYQWVYRNVKQNLVLFDYQRGRSGECLHPNVKKHKGFLQTDGYSVYDSLDKLPDLTRVNCLAHVRREFFEAKDNDTKRAEIALQFIQNLYKIEEEARTKNLTPEQITALRIEKATPILTEFKTWLDKEALNILPQSAIGKAFTYAIKRWNKIAIYAKNGCLEIDNNRIENAIRPLALGRKNYLFAGSDEGGKRAAMMYSFFATCAAHNINPLSWLTDVLNRITDHNIKSIHELLPHIWAEKG